MDEQAENTAGAPGSPDSPLPDTSDQVEAIDLASDEEDRSRVGGSSRAGWLGRIGLAVMAVALVAGGIVLSRDDGDSGPDSDLDPLAIGSDGTFAETGVAAADMAFPGSGYEYQLAGSLPDLGSSAPAYQLIRPERGADDWSQMASAFGVDAAAVAGPDGSFVADDGTRRLDVYPVPGAWSVSVGESWDDGVTTSDGSSGGGSASSPGDAGMTTTETFAAIGGAVDAQSSDAPVEVIDEDPYTTITAAPPPPPDVDMAPLTSPDPVPAADLPSRDEAEARARALLDEAGVLDGADWEVEVVEGGVSFEAVGCAISDDVSASEECAVESEPPEIQSWTVVFHRVVDDVVTSGLEWSVDVGAGPEPQYVYGTVADLEPLGDYPLRTTQAAYDELVDQSGGYGDDVGVPQPMPATDEPATDVPATDVPVAPPVSVVDTVVGDTDSPTVTAYSPEPVRLRPEECATGIEPGYCVPDWCVGNAGDPMCDEPCTADSLECSPATDVCNGDPASSCTQPYPDEQPIEGCLYDDPGCDVDPGATCVPGPAVDCALVDPVPVTTIPVCNDTVEVLPVPADGREPMTEPACVDPGISCEEAGPDECAMPEQLPVPEPTVITVTGAELTAIVTWGVEDGVEVQYLVPAYRFLGSFPDGSEWTTDMVAVSDALVVPPGEVEEPAADTTLPPLPPSTSIDEPDCSNENPEGCVDSIPTPTSYPIEPCDDTAGVPGEEPDSGAYRCVPSTTLPDPPITTIPPITGDGSGGQTEPAPGAAE